MRVAALKNTDPWFARMQQAIASGQVDSVAMEELAVEHTIEVNTVSMMFDGPDRGHRPWLQISGLLRATAPELDEEGDGEGLPYGISELTFPISPGTQMDYRFDFSEDEIADLVRHKGLYQQGFDVPQGMNNIEWVLPGTVDVFVIAPGDMDQPPLVFVNIHDQNTAQIDVKSSGYALLEYFPDFEDEFQVAAVPQGLEPGQVRVRSGELDDLFAGRDITHLAPDPELMPTMDRRREAAQEAEPGIFARLVRETNERRQAEQALIEAELNGMDPDRPESLYVEMMATPADQAWEQEERPAVDAPADQAEPHDGEADEHDLFFEAGQEAQDSPVRQATLEQQDEVAEAEPGVAAAVDDVDDLFGEGASGDLFDDQPAEPQVEEELAVRPIELGEHVEPESEDDHERRARAARKVALQVAEEGLDPSPSAGDLNFD